jgi:YVTN family beta-propeller protein
MKRILVVAALVLATSASASKAGGNAVALITAEQQNQLISLELSSGKVLRRVSLPADPQGLAVGQTTLMVASPAAGAVTLLSQGPGRLKILRIWRDFGAPHIVLVDPLRTLAYVTDDSRGELSVIGLGARRIVARVFVGAGAHHMTLGPGGHRLWIALGEHASGIAIVDVTNPFRPWVVRRISLPFVAHDLAFDPDGRRVWVSSGVGDSVHVLNARTGKEAFAVRVGTPPQHVAFSDGRHFAFATSGYSGQILKIDPNTGRVLARAKTPYGSFNLSAIGSLVVTTSLLNGIVTEFDENLRRMRTIKAASAARSVALTVW